MMRSRTTSARRSVVTALTVVLSLGTWVGGTPTAMSAADPGGWWARLDVPHGDVDSISLNDVSTLGPRAAWATAATLTGGDTYDARVFRWNGDSWSAMTDPFPPAINPGAIEAITANDIWVTASALTEGTSYHWNGTTWTERDLPGTSVLDLDAAATDAVWGVVDLGATRSLYRWDGDSWDAIALPNAPAGQAYEISVVDGRTATEVWVAGQQRDLDDGTSVPLVLRRSGTTWTAWPLSGPTTGITDIAATGANSASVTSSDFDGSDGSADPRLHRWDGASWTATPFPAPAGLMASDVRLSGIEFAGGDPWLVGHGKGPNGHPRAFVAHEEDGVWATSVLGGSPDAGEWSISGFSLRSEGCFAVGGTSNAPLAYAVGARLDAVASPSEVAFGGTAQFDGTVSSLAGAVPAGIPVHVERTDPEGATTMLPMVTTDSDGTFSFSDAPDVVGQHTYHLTADGSTTTVPATGSATLVVGQKPTSVQITPEQSVVDHPNDAKLEVSLTGFTEGSKVALYRKKPGGSSALVAREAVDGSGVALFRYSLEERTVFFAEFDGDATYLPATSPDVEVLLRPDVRMTLLKADAKRGTTFLYHFSTHCPTTGRDCPRLGAYVNPRTSACVRARLEAKVRREWTLVDRPCFQPDGSGLKLIFVYRGRDVIGVDYRVRVETTHTSKLEAATSKWRYFTIIR